nr:s-m checkpoint control protein rad4 [Quercus suber]
MTASSDDGLRAVNAKHVFSSSSVGIHHCFAPQASTDMREGRGCSRAMIVLACHVNSLTWPGHLLYRFGTRHPQELGAVHKLDLTCDVTHLICGSTNTPKYQYTARERPDIAVLHPNWLEAVRQAWMTGDEVDVAGLAQQHKLPTFFELKACLTGFTDPKERENFKHTFEKHGAEYHGDLTKQVTHLVTHTASGPKYEHALSWRIHVVTAKWFQDSLQRGMVLDEALYHPSMPVEDQGRGAFKEHLVPRTNLGKRARAIDPAAGLGEEARKRKLRRSASARLNADSQDLWQDIGAGEDQSAASMTDQWRDDSVYEKTNDREASTRDVVLADTMGSVEQPALLTEPRGLFVGACVLIHGFSQDRRARLLEFLKPGGAIIIDREADFEPTYSASSSLVRYLLVPHTAGSQLPAIPAGTKLVSQWWVERCVQHKCIYDPEIDALSQPLPVEPVPGFDKLSISMTGFDSVDLRQSAEAVKKVGAKYQEVLASNVSVLLSAAPSIKYEKAQYAAKHRIAAVRAEWFYDCLKSRSLLPFNDYRITLAPFNPRQTGSPASSETITRNSKGSTKAVEGKPQRLSNVRRAHSTGSLSFQASSPASAPAATSRRKAPFILEDDDDDTHAPPALPEDQTSKSTASYALKERSPNASPRKSPLPITTHGLSKPNMAQSLSYAMPTPTDHFASPAPSPSKGTSQFPHTTSSIEPLLAAPAFSRPPNELAADLASLLSRSSARDHASVPAARPLPAKRKQRPLGRNLSGSNARPCSASLEPRASASPPPEAALLGTQIGYETVDADAHRQLMEKRMNVDLRDRAAGQRVASVGTVTDSGRAAGHGGEGRRERHRPR